MGSAIASGLISTGFIPAADITVTSPRRATLDRIAAACPGIVTDTDNAAAVRGADVIILAVKPWMVQPVVEEIAPRIDFREQTRVSLAATVSLADFDNILRNYSTRRTVVRAIPNTAMAVGSSMTFICHAPDADETRTAPVVNIFNSLGTAAVIPESQLGAAMVAVDDLQPVGGGPRPPQGRVDGSLSLGAGHAVEIQFHGAALNIHGQPSRRTDRKSRSLCGSGNS